MSKIEKVPKLRFPEFSGEWEVKKIEDIFEFKNGINKEKEFFGKGFPIINFKDVYNQYELNKNNILGLVESSEKEQKNFSAKKGDVFFTRTSETILDIGMSAVLMEEIESCVFSGFVLRARPTHNVLLDSFKKYCFSIQSVRKEIVTKSSFTTRALTSGTLLNKVIFKYPFINEQEKIASFLTSVDTKIEQLTKKEQLLREYKKGVMQKIFSQEIRFKDDSAHSYPDWTEKKFGEVFTRITTKNKENNQNVLTISAQQGLINQEKYFNKSVSAKDVTGYYLLHKDDFAYNKSYSKGYPMGAIKRLNNYDKGVVSTLYICFRTKDDNVDFLEQYFNNGNLNRELHKIAQEGARNHGLLNMSVIEFFNDMTLFLPSKPEQEKIASFLSSIDSKIEQASEQLNRAKQFKKALLQQMFV